jgi:UDP-N-acetylglucosamine:LPS N-acetylglucosamine transferase
MKIALVSSHGGHLTEISALTGSFEEYETFHITYQSPRTESLDDSYLVENIGTSPIKMIYAFISMVHIFAKERPDVIVSTGAEIAIPAFLLGWVLGCENVFIESLCRVRTKSKTGQIVYYLSNKFLVQWEELESLYGDKAEFRGSVL